jgi:small nuclear ribonucleoprotein (snRNP)-like protein
MIFKTISRFLIATLLFISVLPAQVIAARKQTADWSSLTKHLNTEIAVKADNRKTVFGILSGHKDHEITVLTGVDSVTEIVFKRETVGKIWLATLKGGRNIGKGALIGAGTGASAGLIYIAANRDSADGQASLAAPAFAIYGAGIGAAIGFFTRKRNQKKQLIYQR